MLPNLVAEYFGWGGRFSATILITAFASTEALLLSHYYLVPLSILLLNLLAAWHFLGAIKLRSLPFFVLFCAMLLATFQMRESLFWLSGGATYGIARALLLALMAEEWKIHSAALEPGIKRVSLLALGGFLLAGLNEVASLAHLTLVFLLSASLVLRHKRGRLYLLAAFGALTGTLVAGLAPGNFVRATANAHHVGLLSALLGSLGLLVKKYVALIVLHTLLFTLLLWASRPDWRAVRQEVKLLPVALCLMLALWAGIFPRVYALDALGPDRSRSIDFLLINLIALVAALGMYGRAPMRDETPRPTLARLITLCGIVVLFLLPNAAVTRLTSALQQSAILRQVMDERIVMARQSDHGSLIVKAYTYEPKPVTYFSDVTSDQRQWQNICFARYFHLKEISTQ
ncbi:hypothetical protein RB25_08445 [Herbaspirillum rubrisubalbicans]|uniref:DUF4153 domain-containing protein n=1 Tax=Herbaspirillum rubrisubalbicans TaxID=80842 RepID=A0ABX9C437_9BURK|nr:hypothetical protein RB24_07540 [Herbaspirillum rubrisubalbicans]RAN48783.1 hypothetical protein RB25_08445 [Herbaspirillum rubrisubalbicans]